MEGYYENGVLTRCFFAWYNLRLGYGERLNGQGTQCEPYSTNDYNPLYACTSPTNRQEQADNCIFVVGANCGAFYGFSLKAACNANIQSPGTQTTTGGHSYYDSPYYGGGLPETYDCD